METLNKLWAGSFYGTNTGKLFMVLVMDGSKVAAQVRLSDDRYGVYMYAMAGTFAEVLELSGSVVSEVPPGMTFGDAKMRARLTAEGQLRGTWETTINSGGTFEAYPHDINDPDALPRAKTDNSPEQVFSQSATIGAVRLYADDVRELVSQIREDFTAARVIATYNVRGSQVVRYADQFIAEFPNLCKLDYLKLNIQELEAHGINRSVLVELTAFGSSEVRVQGIRESWVKGKTDVIAGSLREKQSGLLTAFRRYGLVLNQVIFYAMLVAMPALQSWQQRAIFAAFVLLLTVGLFQMHARVLPGTTILLGSFKPSFLSRTWPSVVSWASGVAATILASYVFYWLTKGAAE